MRYSYQHPTEGWLGPYTLEELRQLHREGSLSHDTPILREDSPEPVRYGNLETWIHSRQADAGNAATPPPLPPLPSHASPPPRPGPEPASPAAEPGDSFTRRAGDDLRALLPHLALPLEELRTFRWVENRKTLSIAGVGLLPLVIYSLFGGGGQMGNAFWAMALYFSVLWALFFYSVFPAPEARFSLASLCFLATGLFSVGVLLQLHRIWPLNMLLSWTDPSHDLITRWLGFVLGVGIPEETCKALILLLVIRRWGPLPPHALLFYGLMAGLGFGIYEGISYQTSQNFRLANSAAGYRDQAIFAAEYYLLNLIRLTTLPFLHAIWTGMAGYFIGFAAQFPDRKRGLLIVAVGIPALLHGTYNAFSAGAVGLIIALVSVLALNLYLARSVEFERLLEQQRASREP